MPETHPTTQFPTRALPIDEWDRLLTLPPFQEQGLPDPRFWRIIVAEQGGPGGRIVAHVSVWTAVHCEPVWFDPDARHHPALFMGIWREARQVVEDAGGSMVFATIDDDRPDLQTLWEKFGFVRAPGRLYVGLLDRLPD